jgi:hypothetical protein
VISLFITQNRGSFVQVEETHGRIAKAVLDEWA